ncbi:hypothetical protein F2P79_022363 [Pimephales promelas]|nr:hypothetical protein F2P79_022363 [Pimephales promelas]
MGGAILENLGKYKSFRKDTEVRELKPSVSRYDADILEFESAHLRVSGPVMRSREQESAERKKKPLNNTEHQRRSVYRKCWHNRANPGCLCLEKWPEKHKHFRYGVTPTPSARAETYKISQLPANPHQVEAVKSNQRSSLRRRWVSKSPTTQIPVPVHFCWCSYQSWH